MIETLEAKLIGFLVLVALCAGCWFYVRHLHALITEVEDQNKVLVTENSSLKEAIKVQNTAVDKLKADSDARLASALSSLSKAKAETVSAQAKASSIRNIQAPAASASCEVKQSRTLDLLNGASQ
jgi:hypothetical protein